MAQIILVHGMAANKESWFDIPDRLRAAGHDVQAETLPGHEGPFGFQLSLDTLRSYVTQIAGLLPPNDKVTLIGHSMGGQVISAVAAAFPGRIEQLIYIAAMMPRNGQSAVDVMREAGIDRHKMRAELKTYRDAYPQVFGSQPIGALFGRLRFSTAAQQADYGALPAYAVICANDDVLPTAYQNQATAARGIPVAHCWTLPTGHIPQVEDPEALMAVLSPLVAP